MALPVGPSVQVFVGCFLLLLALTLLVAGRRRPEGVVLAAFLSLVGTNLVAGSLHFITGDSFWERLGLLVLAADPFFLILFLSKYPYRRKDPGIRAALIGLLASGAALVLLVLFRPESTAIKSGEGIARSPGFLLVVAQLVVAYSLAWFMAVRSQMEAPTKILARRANWLVVAVGVAVIPRLGLVPEELGISAKALVRGLPNPWNIVAASVLATAFSLAIAGLLIVAGLRRARLMQGHDRSRSPVLVAGALAGSILVVGDLFRILYIFNPEFQGMAQIAWSLRWIVFGSLLVYALLSYELLDFPAIAPRGVALLGGALTAFAGFLLAAAAAQALGIEGNVVGVLGFAGGAASVFPGAAGARALMRRFGPSLREPSQTDNRLELFRAALEVAWVHGPPTPEARRRLERERRAFGISHDEARVLEHVVATTIAAAPRLKIGDEPLPGVVVESQLGQGSHGLVMAARRVPSGEKLVIKEFPLDRGGASVARRQLWKELRPIRSLRHPNVVELQGFHAVPGRYLLLYEFVDGKTLAELLRAGPLAPDRARRIAADVLGALEASHQAGIVHRDVKPSNILVDSSGRARLTDFGVAAFAGPPEDLRATVTNLDALGAAAGTLAYMAPEQLHRGPARPSTDVYQAGLVLFEMLTGRPALDIQGHDVMEALERIAHPSLSLENIPAAWRPTLSKALEASLEKRFLTAAEMRASFPGEGPPATARRAPTAGRPRVAKA